MPYNLKKEGKPAAASGKLDEADTKLSEAVLALYPRTEPEEQPKVPALNSLRRRSSQLPRENPTEAGAGDSTNMADRMNEMREKLKIFEGPDLRNEIDALHKRLNDQNLGPADKQYREEIEKSVRELRKSLGGAGG